MKLYSFIMDNIELLLQEWEDFAKTMFNDVQSKKTLRDHAKEMLLAIAQDLQQQIHIPEAAAEEHGIARMEEGFSLNDIGAEYRALRTNVIKHWGKENNIIHASDLDDLVRFNESIDQSLIESITSYTLSKEKQTHHFDTMLSASLGNPCGVTEENIWHTVHYDDLTGLPNRRLFRDRLDQAIKHAKREDKLFALLSIDLDRFKEVNDRLGHGAGDSLLQKAGDRIRACVRETDTVARIGGDEFMVILTNVSDAVQTKIVSEKILNELARSFQIEQQRVYISGSIGITLCPKDGSEPEMLLQNADRAMYVAKKLGRNRLSFYEGQLISNA